MVIGRCWYTVIPFICHLCPKCDVIEQHWIAIGVVGIVGILSWIVIERRNLLQTSQQRGTQNQITGFLLIGLALLSVIIINIIAVRYNQKKYDFTKQQRYTLSEQSVSILKDIKQPIQVKTYFTASSPAYTEFRSTRKYRTRDHISRNNQYRSTKKPTKGTTR